MHKVINNDPYGELICRWFQHRFPASFNKTKESTLEILSDLFMGTKEVRLGPLPSPERQVQIRKILGRAIELRQPIPVLVPWGGRKSKPRTFRLDIAEVSGLLQIMNLDSAVRAHYGPGLNVHIRIEDTNAKWLYRQDDNVNDIVNRYSSDFVSLMNILGGGTLTARRESDMMNEDQYMSVSKTLSIMIEKVLTKQLAYPTMDIHAFQEFKDLQETGWRGTLPDSQIQYYLGRYQSLYPDMSSHHYVRMLADYFAGSKARYDLGGRGAPDTDVAGFIQLSFTPPVPGSPESLFNSTIHWRTIPMSQARTHISPWRGKGYFKINNGNDIKCKIASFSDEVVNTLVNSVTTLQNAYESVEIDADYLLE